MSFDDEQFNVVGPKIEKSSSNIHQTLDPKKKISASQAKALNAVQYKLQQLTKELQVTPDQFHKNHPGNITVTMPSSEFRRLICCPSSNTAHMRKIMSELKDLSVSEDTLDSHTGKGRLAFRNLFIAAEYTDAVFRFEIPSATTRLLVTETPSAIIDLLTVANKLSSKYAVFLNDLLEEYSYKESSDDFTIIIEDSKLRNLLKIPFTEHGRERIYSYPQPAMLQRKAVQPAVEGINEANFRFRISEYDYKRNKATDGAIYWRFSVVSQKSLALHQFTEKNRLEIELAGKELTEIAVSAEAAQQALNSLSSDYDLAYLRYNIKIVKDQMKKGKAANPGGLFVSCMARNKEAFDPVWKHIQLDKETKLAHKRRLYEESLKQEREAHTEELIDIKVENLISTLNADRSRLEDMCLRFAEYLEKVPTPSAKFMKDRLSKIGADPSVLHDSLFVAFLHSEVRKNLTQQEVDYFSKSKGSVINLD